ncbi:aspartyl protease family protein [Branchiibius sp. NY16-3462-2]|uniref:aspartyl protease family protein n=1 Tax=Branchiibius sp. NY16-3462-2 TaxID=1807500 RepID=UPI0007998F0E|nr:aspartyl protease family protein [Branchiibius sp. NY16-3462-2]KYH45432.1 hypothetical protein AZH51_01905 [Branchiibius sp. NY16-3462-2]
MVNRVTFDRVQHFVRVPVMLENNTTARFLVDTGIGITVIHPEIASAAGVIATDQVHVGHRMSGQPIAIEIHRMPSLRVGQFTATDVAVGVFDLGPRNGPDGFDGIVGLDVLAAQSITIDPFAGEIVLGDDQYDDAGFDVPIRVERDGPSVACFTDLMLPDGQVTEVEIDTGSGSTILDTRFQPACGIDPSADADRIARGIDETGHSYLRQFQQIRGALTLPSAPATAHENPTVMFQDIALNGLIGADFLDRFIQTYDISRNRLILRQSPTGVAAQSDSASAPA